MPQKNTIPFFVDIDGVANSTRSVFTKIGPDEESTAVKNLEAFCGPLNIYVQYALKTVDPVCVALLNRVFRDTQNAGFEPVFVLSSTHRKYLCDGVFGATDHIAKLREYLKAMGFAVPQKLCLTDVLHAKRGHEVQEWLRTNGYDEMSDTHVIIDDSADFESHQPLVRVDPHIGFSFENFAETCKYLGLKVSNVLI